MAFCPQCGAESAGSFCAKCGSALGYAGASASGGTYTPPAPAAVTTTSAGLSENAASALCYVLGLITGIVFLVLEPYSRNRNVRFHAFQSIFFHVGTIVCWIAYMILSVMLGVLTHHLSGLIMFPLWLLMCVGFFCIWLYLMYSAYNNKKVILPIVGPLAQKQAGV